MKLDFLRKSLNFQPQLVLYRNLVQLRDNSCLVAFEGLGFCTFFYCATNLFQFRDTFKGGSLYKALEIN